MEYVDRALLLCPACVYATEVRTSKEVLYFA